MRFNKSYNGRYTAFIGLLLVAGTFLMASQSTTSTYADDQWMLVVDRSLLNQIEREGQIEFIVSLKEQADLAAAERLSAKSAKGAYVYETLREVASRTQKPIIAELGRLGASYRSFWVSNMIWVKGDSKIIPQIASRNDISFVFSNPRVTLEPLTIITGASRPSKLLDENLWNLEIINAPQAWQQGITGEGIVVGGQDTGYDWQHIALKNQYRGWDGSVVNHNYNWHDAIHDGDPQCGPDSVEPCDGHGHGTHTMGTIVGDDGQGQMIGVAPEASWIGCRNMNDNGQGTPASYIECYQWFIAPTDLNNENPDFTAAPDVINNSWSCPVSEGCIDPNVLKDVVESVRAAGILTVHSAGNSGSSCSTVNTPAAIYDASFSVGATTSQDVIWSGSSRGPVEVDSSQRLKPDITAPGNSIFSSWPNDSYVTLTGTSMAGPHVVGAAALLLDAQSSLIGDPTAIETVLSVTAEPKLATQDCGDIGIEQIPNNTYGYGRIDVFAAITWAMNDKKSYIPFAVVE